MLPTHLKRELSVLFFIINKKVTTLKEISDSLNVTKPIVRATIATINKHSQEFLCFQKFIVSNTHNSIYVHEDIQNEAVNYAYQLKLSLLKTSTLFNYCVLLITNNQIKECEILKQLSISDSYLKKMTSALNRYFKSFKFKVTIKSGVYSLTGDEHNIRLFSYLYLQDSFQDIEWPFPTISMNSLPSDTLKTHYQRSNSNKGSLAILFTVLKIRILGGNNLQTPSSNKLLSVMQSITDNFDVTLLINERIEEFSNELTPNQRYLEKLYLNFYTRIFIADLIPEKNKIDMGEKFWQLDNPFCELTRNVFNSVSCSQPNSTSQQKFINVYYMTILNIFYFLVDTSYDSLTDLFIPNLQFYLDVDNNLMRLLKKNISKVVTDQKLVSLLSSLVYTSYKSELKPSLAIYIQMAKDFTAHYFIKTRLYNLFNANNIFIVNDYSLANLVITDTFETVSHNKKIFYLEDVNNERSWEELLSLIQQLYLEKIQKY